MRFVLLAGLAGLLGAFAPNDTYRKVENESFTSGEKLHYRVHYGFIDAAESTVEVDNNIQEVNERPCYKVNVHGHTVGSFDFFLRIRDTWRSYIDTAALVPHKFYRNIEEGKYRKKETVTFDHERSLALIDSKDKKNSEYKMPRNVQDIVSGFYFLRTVDLNSYKPGQKINVSGFFAEELFSMDVTYKGKEVLSTDMGKIKVHRLVPVMPENKLFDGKEAVSVYLSDDKNKIPVKMKANMFVGTVEVDLVKYSGLRNDLNLQKDNMPAGTGRPQIRHLCSGLTAFRQAPGWRGD